MPPPLALLVEADPARSRDVERLLHSEGFEVELAADGPTGLGLARRRHPEVLVVGTVPDLDATEFCRRLRRFSDTYVIAVTRLGSRLDLTEGWAAGIDAFLPADFSATDFARRINALRERTVATAPSANLRYGSLLIDPDARQVRFDDRPVDLTKIEYDLLAQLITAPGQVFTRAQLLEAVWGTESGANEHSVDVHIANLRTKLGESGRRPRHIRTERGLGFSFDPDPAITPPPATPSPG